MQYRLSKRQRAPNCENGLDSVTSPRTILPASVALSNTIAAGTRPQRRKISSSPAHRHFDLCDMRATHCRSFKCGGVAGSGLRSRARASLCTVEYEPA